MAGVDLSYVKAFDDDVPDERTSRPDNRYGVADNVPAVTPFGKDAGIDGFYDSRDDLVGSTNTQWNRQPADVEQQSGASFASYGDSAPSFQSGSGLGGERCGFSDVLGPDDLAEGKF